MEKLTEFVSKSFDPKKSALSVHYLAQSAAKVDETVEREDRDSNPSVTHSNLSSAANGTDTTDLDQQQSVHGITDTREEMTTINTGSYGIREQLTGDTYRAMLPTQGHLDLQRLTGLANLHGLTGLSALSAPTTQHLHYHLPLLLSHHQPHHHQHRRFTDSPHRYNSSPPVLNSSSPNRRGSISPPSPPLLSQFTSPRLSQQTPYRILPMQSTTASPHIYSCGSPSPDNSSPHVGGCNSPYQPQFDDEDVEVDVEAPESPMEDDGDCKGDCKGTLDMETEKATTVKSAKTTKITMTTEASEAIETDDAKTGTGTDTAPCKQEINTGIII